MYQPTGNPYSFKYLVTGMSGPGIEQVYLPEAPPDKDILFKEENKFVRPELPKHLKKAIRIAYSRLDKYGPYYDPNYLSPYAEEIQRWEDQQHSRFDTGIWFWNNGVRTYITGFYYWYLTEWNPYFGKPEYRETDKEITYLLLFVEEDDRCYGLMLNTIRRYGKSAVMGGWSMWRTIRNFGHYTGMQGETDDKIAKFWHLHIIKPFRKLLGYTKPVYDSSSKQTEDIRFERPMAKGLRSKEDADLEDEDFESEDSEDLESYMDYREKGEGAYDQAVLHTYLMEEPGKCTPAGTLVRMFDGSVKKCEDVVVGDMLRGDDNVPRLVKRTGSGFGKIYKINPNKKAEPWYVNEDHILSCKLSASNIVKGYKKGDVINICIKDYLALTPNAKRHFVCYRVGVEYTHNSHDIDPYFLGIWLGDGGKHGSTITNEESEIVEWLYKEYSSTHKINQSNRSPTYYIKNGIRSLLKNKNLLLNKHIPNDYLIDSRENRLKLLAGLIDTDGHRECRDDRPNQRSYEITQKNKELAYQIKELCFSLGFYASLKEKIATMKRKDGSIYKCPVYRMSIYGRDLHDIPCKVKRKQMPKNITTYNSKDPSIYGFTVSYDRDDYYYGFNITGNRLYLLADYTVTHNTLKANVNDRWETVKPCLRRGKFIRGKALLATTVEHMNVMDKGGRAYQKIFYESDYDKRTPLNQTVSGLYVAFLPGDCAYEGFYDDYGHPMRSEARRSILIERETKKHNPKDHSALIRKYPLTISEIFWVSSDQCIFNGEILQRNKLKLDSTLVPLWSKYELAWEGGKRFSKIIIKHNEVTGWYRARWMFPTLSDMDTKANQVLANPDGTYSPLNEKMFIAGCDPVDHRVKIEQKMGFGEDEYVSTRRSRPVLQVKRRYDSSIDVLPDGSPGFLTQELLEERRDKEYEYKTGIYIGMMDVRPGDPNVYYERALMICWLHGMSMSVESAKPGVINYFTANGCADFIKNKYIPESSTKIDNGDMGTPANPMTINEYTDCLMTNIEYFGHMECFIENTNDHLLFDPANTKVHDHTVAKGFCELGEKIRPKNVSLPVLDLHSIMPVFDRYGNIVQK